MGPYVFDFVPRPGGHGAQAWDTYSEPVRYPCDNQQSSSSLLPLWLELNQASGKAINGSVTITGLGVVTDNY